MHPVPPVYGGTWLQIFTGKKHKDLEFYMETLGKQVLLTSGSAQRQNQSEHPHIDVEQQKFGKEPTDLF